MATVQQISEALNTANAYYHKLWNADIANSRAGFPVKNKKKIKCLSHLIQALYFDYNGSYNDATTSAVYEQLLIESSPYSGSILPFDPSVIIPGQPIIIIPGGVVVNATRIPFTNQTAVTLSNYQATYSAIYGNFADISIWTSNGDGTYTEDTATVPTVTNLDGDINLPDNYTWTYPFATSGYIQISGFITAT